MAMSSLEEESDSESEAEVKRRGESVDSEIERLEQKGLLTAKEMALIQSQKSKEAEINKLAQKSKNARTIYRDKEGRKKTLDQIKNAKEEWAKKQKEQLKKWSTGLVQK